MTWKENSRLKNQVNLTFSEAKITNNGCLIKRLMGLGLE